MPECPECFGSGWFSPTDSLWDRWECLLCGGLGKVPWPHPVTHSTGQVPMIRALKFIAGCLLFATAMAVIAGWMVILDAMVAR